MKNISENSEKDLYYEHVLGIQNSPFNESTFWFIPSADPNRYRIYLRETKEQIGLLTELSEEPSVELSDISDNIDDGEDMIKKDFVSYTARPEYAVSKPNMRNDSYSLEELQFEYEWLLLGCMLIRSFEYSSAGTDIDEKIKKFDVPIEALRKSDFYRAPSSTRFHDCFEGGLVYHSLKVVQMIHKLRLTDIWHEVSLAGAVLCALVHDWCKIGLYEKYMKNVKDETTGVWEKVSAYRRKDSIYPMGHGVSSFALASRYFRLSPEEALAIRWHMGRWNVADEEQNDFQKANEVYPMVHLLQFADMLSITDYVD